MCSYIYKMSTMHSRNCLSGSKNKSDIIPVTEIDNIYHMSNPVTLLNGQTIGTY